MVVGAGDEHARFLKTDAFNKLEILLVCSDPRGYFREVVAKSHTFLDRAAILFGIYEEFALSDKTLGSAETVKKLENINDLRNAEGRGGLLTVTEGRIGDPYILRHIYRYEAVVEGYLRNAFVVEKMTVKVGCFSVLKLVFV
jgi:hypothetical protein